VELTASEFHIEAATFRRLYDQAEGRRRRSSGCFANLIDFDDKDGVLVLNTTCPGSQHGAWQQVVEIVSWPALKKIVLQGPRPEPSEMEEAQPTAPTTPDELKRKEDLLKRFKMSQTIPKIPDVPSVSKPVTPVLKPKTPTPKPAPSKPTPAKPAPAPTAPKPAPKKAPPKPPRRPKPTPRPIDFDEVRAKASPELHQADVRIFCGCPDFLYSGAWWKAQQMKVMPADKEQVPAPQRTYAPMDPSRRRRTRYKLKGRSVLCKHLAAVYSQFFR